MKTKIPGLWIPGIYTAAVQLLTYHKYVFGTILVDGPGMVIWVFL